MAWRPDDVRDSRELLDFGGLAESPTLRGSRPGRYGSSDGARVPPADRSVQRPLRPLPGHRRRRATPCDGPPRSEASASDAGHSDGAEHLGRELGVVRRVEQRVRRPLQQRATEDLEARIRRSPRIEPSNAELAPGVRLERLEPTQLTLCHPCIQPPDEPQQIRKRLPRVWMNDEERLEISSRRPPRKRAHEAQDLAVRLQRVVQRKGSNIKSDRLPEASRPREGTHREATEYLVRLLDELLRPPDDRVDDVALALTGDFEKLPARLAATGQGPSADRAATQPSPANLKPETSGNAE